MNWETCKKFGVDSVPQERRRMHEDLVEQFSAQASPQASPPIFNQHGKRPPAWGSARKDIKKSRVEDPDYTPLKTPENKPKGLDVETVVRPSGPNGATVISLTGHDIISFMKVLPDAAAGGCEIMKKQIQMCIEEEVSEGVQDAICKELHPVFIYMKGNVPMLSTSLETAERDGEH